MSNYNDLKPWFRDDIARVLMSIYFASLTSNSSSEINGDFRSGYAAAISGIAIGLGINPESFLVNDDLRLLREFSQRIPS